MPMDAFSGSKAGANLEPGIRRNLLPSYTEARVDSFPDAIQAATAPISDSNTIIIESKSLETELERGETAQPRREAHDAELETDAGL